MAQSDFATLQQSMPQGSSASASQNSSPIAQAFCQLSQDLKSEIISGTQQDYANIRQDFQSQASQSQSAEGHHHHHHRAGGDSHRSGRSASAISQLFNELGTALQSGNLSNAQQAYRSLQQGLLQSTQGGATTSRSTFSSSSGTGSVPINE